MTRARHQCGARGQYCIDTSRYFATGFSYGGSMSFTAGCNMHAIPSFGAAAITKFFQQYF